MNKLITIIPIMSVLGSGCSGYDPESDSNPDVGEPELLWSDWSEDTQVQDDVTDKALTVTFGYGVRANTSRCDANNPWTGCVFPKNKTYKFHNRTATGGSTCNGTYATVMRNGAVQAIDYWKPILENRGYTVTVDTLVANASSGSPQVDVSLYCGGQSLGVFVGGTAPHTYSHPFPISHQHFYGASVYMNPDDMNNILALTTDAATQTRFAKIVFQHELGHTVSLGQAPGSECGASSNEIMCSAGRTDLGDPSTWGTRNASTTEKNWIRDYVTD